MAFKREWLRNEWSQGCRSQPFARHSTILYDSAKKKSHPF